MGRTRFCVHPRERVKAIPVVGGTKTWDLEKLRELAPDVVLLDRGENPRSMVDESPSPVRDTHVDSLESLAAEMDRLGTFFKNDRYFVDGESYGRFGVRALNFLKSMS